MLANFVPSSASAARRSIATWKSDGQPLQHDATKYAHHTAAAVDFDNSLKSTLKNDTVSDSVARE
jgi:hypothetical protein